ncbi:hypothetical protein WP50_00240, partial [Lactiplantibacillus plantarum]
MIESLTTRGYFVPFYQLPNDQKPLFFNGKAQAVFDTNALIRDVVYVEAPLDTDHDGQRDLLKVEILRPAETETGLKVPVLYTASPYNQGINDQAGDAQMHNVDVPLTAKEPDENTYADVEFQPTTAQLPAARTATTTTDTAEETFSREKSYTLNDYFLARGFAVVYAAGIGSIDSDGLAPTTRGNNGQTLIESLTTRGYFVPFYQLPNDQKPLFFNGKAQAVFDTNALIRDVVYVEAPLDTDHDGQRDLLKVEILRPAETETGLKVPVLYTASPSNQGINGLLDTSPSHNEHGGLPVTSSAGKKNEDVEFQPTT